MIRGPDEAVPQRSSGPGDCLAGGGAMGALMRAHDWSRTPLGAVEAWPQSLRTAISIMLESRFAMVVAWGRDFRFFYNDRYRPVLGGKHPAALGTPGAEIFPEVWSAVGPEFERVLRGEAFAIDDWLLPLDRNGYLENCWFTLSYSPIRDESGGVGGVLAVVAETTGRVEGERRLATLRDLARRAGDAKTPDHACLSAAVVLEQNPIDVPFALLYLLEDEGRRARLQGSFALPGDHPAHQREVDLAPGSAAPAGRTWPLREAVEGGAAIVVADAGSRFGDLPGGGYPEPAHTAVLLPLRRPGVEHAYGVLVAGVSPRRALDERYRDFFELAADHIATAISNARAFEEERRRAEALVDIDRAKTAFFSNVSHEFRTPLTLMLGPLEEALGGAAGALSGDELTLVHRNAVRLLKLVNALLEFSRIETGRLQAAYEPVDLAALTRDLASSFRSAVERAGIELAVDAAPLPEPALVDRSMWETIVLNLLSNALKFTFEGRIGVSLRTRGDAVELEVEDTGVGIPESELPRVFDRFHRVAGTRARTHEGSGIGLALVQELARLHGGEARVASTVGVGSRFTVSIRRGSAHVASERLAAARPPEGGAAVRSAFVEEALRWIHEDSPLAPAGPANAPGAERILVVDDNSDMRDYLRRILGRSWTVDTVGDGAAALQRAVAEPPDLVLTDVMMPGLDGFELLRALRADERTQGVPVIMLSARAGEEATVEGLQAGADDYLVKPFGARELLARVGGQLALAKARRATQAQRARADLQTRQLHALFMQAPTPICILRGPEMIIELANPPTCEVWGRRAEDVVGRPMFQAIPEMAGQGFEELLEGVRRTGTPYIGRGRRLRILRPDGLDQERYFNFAYEPLRAVDGGVEGVLVIAFDVTQETVAGRETERLRAEAVSANRAKDEFLAMLSHELRNPLAPIRTAVQVVRLKVGGAIDREVTVLERQLEHLVRLVDDLLDVARIARGKIEIKRERLELAEIIAGAIEVASPLIEQRRHQLAVERPAWGLPVTGDAHRLTQVFVNLLTNAARYTEPGGRIEVRATAVAGEAEVSVRDNGAGIDATLLPYIFDLFVQGSPEGRPRQSGLGLGLAIVRNLVDLHGGSVRGASPGPGHGSEFTVRLPLALDAAGDDPPAPAPPSARREQARRVLIVDDNADAAEMLALALSLGGHDVRIAADAPAAVAEALQFRPDVALLDIGLPVVNGYELAQRLRKMEELSALKLVALTGYGAPADRERSRASGFDAHLTKPVDLAGVHQVLATLSARLD